jgi:hypothetical protein
MCAIHFVLYNLIYIFYLSNLDYDMCNENHEEVNKKFKIYGGGGVWVVEAFK